MRGRRSLALAALMLLVVPGIATALRYNLDHDHDIETVTKVREREAGVAILGWAWKITDGRHHQVIGDASDVLERPLTVADPSNHYTDLLVRSIVGANGLPESLWRWNGVKAIQLWNAWWVPRSVYNLAPPGEFVNDGGWEGLSAPHFIKATTTTPARITKRLFVTTCNACTPTSSLTVTWTWSAHAIRYVYSGETGR